MKKLLCLIFVLCAFPAFSQVNGDTARRIQPVSVLPSVCKPLNGDIVYLTTGATGPYRCINTNTWQKIDLLSIKDFGGTGGGIIDDSAALVSACASGVPVIIPAGTYLISNNVSCAADLIFSGGIFSISAGKTLTLTGNIDAVNTQIFSGIGIVSFSGNVSVNIFLPEWWGWNPDNTDGSIAMNKLFAAVYTAGAGEIYFHSGSGYYRADSKLTLPNDGAVPPVQNNITLTGPSSCKTWAYEGGAKLDLRYQGAGGKITTLGRGALEIKNLNIVDGGIANTTPFIYTTDTALSIHDNHFVGSGGQQDMVTLGGTSIVDDGTINSPFSGYGANISNNSFLNLGIALGQTYANGIVISNNSYVAYLALNRAIEIKGVSAANNDHGWMITDNIIEMNALTYGIKVDYGYGNIFSGNLFDDTTVGIPFYITNSAGNTIISSGQISGDSNAIIKNTVIPASASSGQDNIFNIYTPTGGIQAGIHVTLDSGSRLDLSTILCSDSGRIFVMDNTFKQVAGSVFILGSFTAAVIGDDALATIAITDTADKLCIYFDAGKYWIKNNRSGTRTYSLAFLAS